MGFFSAQPSFSHTIQKEGREKPGGGKGLICGCFTPGSFRRAAPPRAAVVGAPMSPPVRPSRGRRVPLGAARSWITRGRAQAQERTDRQHSELDTPAASGECNSRLSLGVQSGETWPPPTLLCCWEALYGAGERSLLGKDPGLGGRAAGNSGPTHGLPAPSPLPSSSFSGPFCSSTPRH